MADFSMVGGGANAIEGGFDYTATSGKTITASGTADTVGTYVEMVASGDNDFTSEEVYIVIMGPGPTSDATFLVNIALGTSDTVIIPNLFAWRSAANSGDSIYIYHFPVRINSGEAIKAGCQSSVASATVDVHIIRPKKSLPGFVGGGAVTAYGANTADTGGTAVVRGGANAFGSWTEIDANIDEEIKGFVVAAIRPVTSWGTGRLTFDVGVGSGTPEIIYSGHLIHNSGDERSQGSITPFIGVSVAEGERLAIQAQAELANTDYDFDYIIYGVR